MGAGVKRPAADEPAADKLPLKKQHNFAPR
jgi:hypothetical protein